MNKIGMGERVPWGDFPKVIRNGNLRALQGEPEYQAAKAGDKQAALDLVDRLLADDAVQRIKDQIGECTPLGQQQDSLGYGRGACESSRVGCRSVHCSAR